MNQISQNSIRSFKHEAYYNIVKLLNIKVTGNLWAKQIISQIDTCLDIIRAPVLSPHTPPPFCKENQKTQKLD